MTGIEQSFRRFARELEFESADGLVSGPVYAVLRRPTEAELIGGMSQEWRVFVSLQRAFTDMGIQPAKGDRIKDPAAGKTYTIESGAPSYAGPDMALYRAEVIG